jgi:outer membrane usher protein FimD/PapC
MRCSGKEAKGSISSSDKESHGRHLTGAGQQQTGLNGSMQKHMNWNLFVTGNEGFKKNSNLHLNFRLTYPDIFSPFTKIA